MGSVASPLVARGRTDGLIQYASAISYKPTPAPDGGRGDVGVATVLESAPNGGSVDDDAIEAEPTPAARVTDVADVEGKTDVPVVADATPGAVSVADMATVARSTFGTELP